MALDLYPKHAEARILIMKRYSFDCSRELFQVVGEAVSYLGMVILHLGDCKGLQATRFADLTG